MVSERRLHSAEALLAHDKDESHSVFHQCHRASKKRFESELTSLKLEGLDQTPDPKIHLAYLANTFTAYKPVSDLKFIKAGFYDRHVCENEIIPTDPQMVPAKFRRIVSKAAPKPPKRYVLDCVLLPIYRPPKRKERPAEPVSLTERSQLRDEVDLAVDSPPRKKAKRTQAPKGPPGSHKATDPEPNHQRRISTNKDSHSKKAVITLESSDGSDSDEGPIKKKARGVTSRPLKSIVAELRFKKNGQTAVADALNTASVQNSTSVPNSVRQSSSSSASPPLPRRHLRRRALPAPNALASSSSEGSNANAATGDVPRRHPERAAPPTAVSPSDGPVATDDPSHTIIAGLTQEISDVKQEVASLRQTTSPGETIKVMTDFVLNIIKMTYPPQPPPPAFHGRNWPISRGYRGRGRGGVSFGDHSRRVYHQDFQQDYRPARQYYVPHGQQWVPPDHGPARRMDAPQYGEERTWSWGPHAEERRAPAFEEQGMRRHSYAEDREDPRAPLRQSRHSTRFSPPNSPGHGLDLVPLPPRTPLRSVGGGAPQGEGNETGSGSEATVTNTVRPWQTPVQGTSAPRPKFFATLRRSEGPPDEQDWEANYAQSEAT
ncbi:hypothetical protein B0H11DRAFT_1170614 [Mycena galericulata]|nr:hypothetical protein B0H11DRAFT_1170614 [Mycena galericulata]